MPGICETALWGDVELERRVVRVARQHRAEAAEGSGQIGVARVHLLADDLVAVGGDGDVKHYLPWMVDMAARWMTAEPLLGVKTTVNRLAW